MAASKGAAKGKGHTKKGKGPHGGHHEKKMSKKSAKLKDSQAKKKKGGKNPFGKK